MKRVTFEEFSQRATEIAKAYQIFVPHITDNITIAFDMYQKILAEDDKRHEVLMSSDAVNKPLTSFDDFERPKCPDDGTTELRMKIRATDADGKTWNTAWVCETCSGEWYSDKTPAEWMNELTRKPA